MLSRSPLFGFHRLGEWAEGYPQESIREWREGRRDVRVELHAGLRNGVVLVEPFETVQARLADADDLDSAMAAGWDAFEFILFVAHKYGGQKLEAFATWMWAMGPASDGCSALEPGPPRREVGLGIDSGDLAGIGEEDAFRALAALSEQLHGKLCAAALDPRPERVHDAKACGRAAEAAAELHRLFALDE